MKYRREIDGLRAVAVLPVILFHAGFSAFSGGFVGVDIFFVISGYLITTIILADKENGKFSLIDFYERRARRILPALFFVMFCCLPFALLWLLPNYFIEFSKSLVAVSVFSSNILFWLESGYFETAAELKPLLHTWSLAVEEQYYVIFPLFLTLMWKLRKRWVFGSLIVITIASLSLAQWGSVHQPSATFYLLPTRIWEIAIGALIAFCFLYMQEPTAVVTSNKVVSESFGLLGMALICYSVLRFDKTTPFPSFYALIPTIGTGLIIIFTTPKTIVGRLLGMKLMVGVGLISYSAYLWHQPLFVFARHFSPTEPESHILLFLSVMSLLLAYISWRFVEIPFRDRVRFSREILFKLTVAGTLFFTASGAMGLLYYDLAPYSQNQPFDVLSFKEYNNSQDDRNRQLFKKLSLADFADESKPRDAFDSILIWGDSHAAALSSGFRLKLDNVIEYASGGCPPLIGINLVGKPECAEMNLSVLKGMVDIHPGHLILHANWSTYWSKEHGFRAVLLHLEQTIELLHQVSPETKITIVGSVPQWPKGLPDYILGSNVSTSDPCSLKLSEENYAKIVGTDAQIRSKFPDVLFLSPTELLCKNDLCPAIIQTENGLSLTAWDSAHLTVDGAKLLSGKILKAIDDKYEKF